MSDMGVDAATVKECADHIMMISRDLRSAGDVQQVVMTGEGVAPLALTVADELFLVAVRLGAPIEDGIDPKERHNNGGDGCGR